MGLPMPPLRARMAAQAGQATEGLPEPEMQESILGPAAPDCEGHIASRIRSLPTSGGLGGASARTQTPLMTDTSSPGATDETVTAIELAGPAGTPQVAQTQCKMHRLNSQAD